MTISGFECHWCFLASWIFCLLAVTADSSAERRDCLELVTSIERCIDSIDALMLQCRASSLGIDDCRKMEVLLGKVPWKADSKETLCSKYHSVLNNRLLLDSKTETEEVTPQQVDTVLERKLLEKEATQKDQSETQAVQSETQGDQSETSTSNRQQTASKSSTESFPTLNEQLPQIIQAENQQMVADVEGMAGLLRLARTTQADAFKREKKLEAEQKEAEGTINTLKTIQEMAAAAATEAQVQVQASESELEKKLREAKTFEMTEEKAFKEEAASDAEDIMQSIAKQLAAAMAKVKEANREAKRVELEVSDKDRDDDRDDDRSALQARHGNRDGHKEKHDDKEEYEDSRPQQKWLIGPQLGSSNEGMIDALALLGILSSTVLLFVVLRRRQFPQDHLGAELV